MKKLLLPLVCALLAPSVFAAGPLATVISDTPTLVFICINIGLTVFFAFVRFNRFSVVHGPEILTTVGIFGCFLGIATALLHFDASNVSDSVPHLLEGVKTAFWASVSGVGGSLVLRARHYFQKAPIPQTAGAPKSATLDDVVAATQALQRSLSGTEEGSLLTQLKLMRQEQVDELKQMRNSFDTFAQRMSEDGSKALIDALKEVIKDFNAQINEQFGDNFKQLNSAVEKLVVWQQQYKEELDKLQAVQKSSADDLRQSAAGLAAFIDRAARFSDVASALETTLQGLVSQHQQIDESQRSMAAVLTQMKDVTPEFARKIDDMTESMKQNVAKLQSDISESVNLSGAQLQLSAAQMKDAMVETLRQSQVDVAEVIKTSGSQMQTSLSEMKDLFSETLKKSQADVTDVVKTCGTQLQTSSAEMKELLVDTLSKSQSEVNESLGKSMEHVRQSVVTLDRGLQEELTKSLESLGRQLASLSEKFVSDYGPLTDRLRDVVRMAGTA
ncbi:hypothetical protein [Paraburkholderia sp. UCT70]|uniref:hypothetical protein n=1 Tax=Paraburkholderia sp. UCT70 TaxID=2991068 RepID=UPI003D20283D